MNNDSKTVFDPSHLQNISTLLFHTKDSLDCERNCHLNNQCIYRSIINRSYYAAFSVFKVWAIANRQYDETISLNYYRKISIKKNKNPPGRHKVLTLFIIDNVDPNYEKDLIKLANKLDLIRQDRNNADYVFDVDLSKVVAETVYNVSQEIISTL